jgi:undecaprenyl-diphosphatase
MSGLSRTADHSKISIAAAAFLALTSGRDGRRAAMMGMASVGLTSAVVNLGLKPLLRRRRPERAAASVPAERQVSMPVSRSFPSGHSAAAFAFAAGAGRALPSTAPALTGLATLVAYSRVHTGVHYPGDVIAGSLFGLALSTVATVAVERVSR